MSVHEETRLRPVTSRQNALVKDLRKAFAQSEPTAAGYIAIEGSRMIEEAIRSGLRFQAVFFSESGKAHANRLLPQFAGQVETIPLPDEVFTSAVATETPQGVAALVKFKAFSLPEILEGPLDDLLMIGLAGVQDPGNVGTILRSAEAFAARAVLLGEKTAGHFNAKAVRASAGSVFRQALMRVQLKPAVALIIGNEGAGVPADVLAQADELMTISHSPRVESLNAGIAASIVLYEAARQRKASGNRKI